MEFQRGQKAKLNTLTSSCRLQVHVRIAPPSGSEIDLSCFGIDAQGKLSDDRYFIFYNQKKSPCGSIRQLSSVHSYDQVFEIDLERLPASIDQLVFTATLDGNNVTMADIGVSEISLRVDGNTVMSFPFAGDLFNNEKAIIIAQIYRKNGWRISAVAQGFSGGLKALLQHFGGEESNSTPPKPSPRPNPKPAPTPSRPRVNLGKITLKKQGQSQKVSLAKRGGNKNVIHINLNWDQPEKKTGWINKLRSSNTDLDLGCMFELSNGVKGVIQPLGNSFGNQHQEPFILLDADDRSGAFASGENMRIYNPNIIRRVLVFAMIYEGAKNFTTVNGRVTIKDQHGSEILVRCDAPDNRHTFCAICMIDKQQDSIRITKEERYFLNHKDCDAYYNFDFRWAAGRK